jgi:hypothetical protein
MKSAIVLIVIFACTANAALNATQKQILIVTTQRTRRSHRTRSKHSAHSTRSAQRTARTESLSLCFADFILERFSLLCKLYVHLLHWQSDP